MDGEAGQGLDALRSTIAAYEASPLLQRALLRLRGQAPTSTDREHLRRLEIGPHGRIAEDALSLVHLSTAITRQVVERGLPEDLTLTELHEITDVLAGRRVKAAEAIAPDCSLLFRSTGTQAALVARMIPGLPPLVDPQRRYATLVEGSPVNSSGATARPQVFLVVESPGRRGSLRARGRLWLDADFLRHEEGFATMTRADVHELETLVAGDLWATMRTVEAFAQE